MDEWCGPTRLRSIPLIEAGREGALPVIEAAPAALADLANEARRRYGLMAMRAADLASRRYLARTANPYLAEIEELAERAALPGVFMLNLSYEWSCTAGIGPDPEAPGCRLLRTLDWPLEGLGRTVVVSRHETAVGPYYNVTWPGFAGVTTAMAPGRFAAAINQPPMRWTSPLMAIDWMLNRWGVWRLGGLPPVHLLRKVCEEAATYAEAKAMLSEAPICLPAFFSLAGLEPEQCCAIERLESRSAVRVGPTSTANHWLCFSVPGRTRGSDSVGRWHQMEAVRRQAADDLGWVRAPILNFATRVAVLANARSGTLIVQGWEQIGPASEVFRLPIGEAEAPAAERAEADIEAPDAEAVTVEAAPVEATLPPARRRPREGARRSRGASRSGRARREPARGE